MIPKDYYYIILGLVGSAYITIFYDIFKHIFKNYTNHVAPLVDQSILIDTLAGVLAIGIGIGVVLGLRRKGKKKNGETTSSNPES